MDKKLLIAFAAVAAFGFLFLAYSNKDEKKPDYAPAEATATANGAPGGAAGEAGPAAGGSAERRLALEQSHTIKSGGDDEGFEADASNLGATFRSVRMRRRQYEQLPNDDRATPLPASLRGAIPDRYYEAGPLELISTWDPRGYPFETKFETFEYAGEPVRRVLRPQVEGGVFDPAKPDQLAPPKDGADFAVTYPVVRAGDRLEVIAPASLAGERTIEAVNADGTVTVTPPFPASAAANVEGVTYRVTVEGPFDQVYERDKRFTLVEEATDRAVFVWPDPNVDSSDVWLERRLIVKGPYAVDLVVQLHNLGSEPVKSQPSLVVTSFQPPVEGGGLFSGPPPDLRSATCRAGGELTRGAADAILKDPQGAEWSPGGDVDWVGIDSRYFLLAAIPTNIKSSRCHLEAALTSPPHATLKAAIGLTRSWVLAGVKEPCRPTWLATRPDLPECSAERAGASGFLSFRLYVGPKDLEHLRAVAGDGVDPKLDESVDFWIVGVIAKPMVWLLKVFHDMIPHWGVAIVLLTILVKLLLLPLTQKSFQSMQAMQRLKPEMEKLKAQYGNDKQKMNEETMALYKRHKVNPLGGCLPMLLQMPVYIALYRAIYSSVELYQAPLFGWVHDLSAPDPYYVLPIILGASMFLQQLISPTSLDSSQARMMKYVMPIMFTVFMLFLPAGLVLYIFVNTLLSMVQQYYIKKKDSNPPTRRRPASAKA